MRVAIVVFPGSNCDRDVFEAIKSISKKLPKFIWHKETHIENFDLIIKKLLITLFLMSKILI